MNVGLEIGFKRTKWAVFHEEIPNDVGVEGPDLGDKSPFVCENFSGTRSRIYIPDRMLVRAEMPPSNRACMTTIPNNCPRKWGGHHESTAIHGHVHASASWELSATSAARPDLRLGSLLMLDGRKISAEVGANG
jgi:hypothetical protein